MALYLHMLGRTIISVLSVKHVGVLLNRYYFCTTTKSSSCKITEYLIRRHNLSPEAASTAASVNNNYKPSDSDAIIDYLKETGLSGTQLEKLLMCDPHVLTLNLDRVIRPKVEAFRGSGFSQTDLPSLISSVRGLLTFPRAPARLASNLVALRNVLASDAHVIKLLNLCNWFLSSDLDKVMMPNIDLMKSCGITTLQIKQLLFNFPRFFLHRTDFLEDCVRRVDEMGLRRDSRMFFYGVRTVSSMSLEKWESKLELFKGLGFTEDDVLSVFRRTPHVFSISERKIKEVTNLILNSARADISFMVKHSELLIYSATRRIRPRLQIIDILQSKRVFLENPSITSVLKVDDDKFLQKYVIPYASVIGEAGDKYMAIRGSRALPRSVSVDR